MKIIISDFDGTITNKDFLDVVIENATSHDEMIRINKQLSKGEITLRQFMEFACSVFRYDDIDKLVEKFNIVFDYSFYDLYSLCKKHNIPLYILSGGLKKVITKFLNGIEQDIIYSHDIDLETNKFVMNENVNTKGKFVRNLRLKLGGDYEIVYIGDGTSDFPVVNDVNLLFVKEHSDLEEKCRNIGKTFISFKKISDVIECLINKNFIPVSS
jgi:2,3-diketo-5-methylthio-1-phosphopentane phosphatase